MRNRRKRSHNNKSAIRGTEEKRHRIFEAKSERRKHHYRQQDFDKGISFVGTHTHMENSTFVDIHQENGTEMEKMKKIRHLLHSKICSFWLKPLCDFGKDTKFIGITENDRTICVHSYKYIGICQEYTFKCLERKKLNDTL